MQFRDFIDSIRKEDFEKVPFGKVLDGSNSTYEIRPTVAMGMSGEPYVTYGIFSVDTGVMETESRQYPAAREWVEGLTALLKGQPMPNTQFVQRAIDDEEEDEEDGRQEELPLH
jgi:hypothetical protein